MPSRRIVPILVAAACCAGVIAAVVATVQRSRDPALLLARAARHRRELFAAIQPVRLANCGFQRFGEAGDGGYLLCGNLLGGARSGYSYGIAGYDQWGCDVATRLGVRVHQYDCFDLRRPACSGGRTVFHEECIGGSRRLEAGRSFDTLEHQISKNGDADGDLVVKMDVEGAEWESLLGARDAVLQRIDQLAVEARAGRLGGVGSTALTDRSTSTRCRD